jgi:predicted small metal-binding protein
MTKILRCSDMGVQCNWTGRAETEAELLKMASEHAATVHGMKEIPKDLLAKAKTLIREEK